MTCQDTSAVLVTCLVVAGVEKVNAQNFALQLRFSSALGIQLLQLAFCCKTNSIYRLHDAITASLVSCSACNKLRASSL